MLRAEMTRSRTAAEDSTAAPSRSFMLAAMNPCPCGFFGDATRECHCSPMQIQRYVSKISGPLLDRIDIHIEVPAVRYKDFEHIALKFGELVEEKHTVVAEGNFAGAGNGAAADEAGVADGVVRGTIRARADEAAGVVEDAGDTVDARGFDGFVEGHGRKNGGNALGEHGFSGARRADEQNVVRAGAGDFKSALGGLLTSNIAQIDGVGTGLAEHLRGVHGGRGEGLGRVDQVGGLREGLDGEDTNAFYDGGFFGVGFGDDDVFDSLFTGGDGGGKSAAHGTHAAIQRELAEKNIIGEGLAEKCALAAEEAEGDGQIESGALFAHVCGSKVHSHGLIAGIIEAAVFQRGLHALAAFLDGDIWQTDNVEISLLAGADVDLDLDEIGFDAVDRGAVGFEEHERGKFVPYCLGAR